MWNSLNTRFAAPARSELQCNIATRRADARRWCQRRLGLFQTQTPEQAGHCLNTCTRPGKGPAVPLAAVQTPTFLGRKAAKAAVWCQKAGRGNERRAASRLAKPLPGQLHKCHCSPPGALLLKALLFTGDNAPRRSCVWEDANAGSAPGDTSGSSS